MQSMLMDGGTAKSIKSAFGARVRAERKRLGLSQEELAARADLDRSYIGGVERGSRNISLLNIYKVARALKVRPEALFQ